MQAIRKWPCLTNFKGLKAVSLLLLDPSSSRYFHRLAMSTPSSKVSLWPQCSILDNLKDVKPAPRHSNQLAVNRTHEIQTGEDEDEDSDENDILHGMKLRLFLAFEAMLLSLFLVAIYAV
jgi:hypothetical protein